MFLMIEAFQKVFHPQNEPKASNIASACPCFVTALVAQSSPEQHMLLSQVILKARLCLSRI